ncbi:PREDICTED: collagen alpha-2(VIII) chain-like [Ficedula albicollis]|uniref:collagen alpha-2(VIII) chain-like n=1 Tax=Ficedula albicollis TaxID=59894 RepID=UPI0007AD96A0|nr:PREDICTED: collagen alpha-2(VIII) chain-like [Ficedula albicollis]
MGGWGRKKSTFWFVFPFPGEAWMSPAAGDPFPQGRGVGSAGVPAFGGVREAPPAPRRSGGRGGASAGSGLYARPGIGGLVLPVGGGGERHFPRHPCGNQPRGLDFRMRHGNASWVGRKARASGLGIGSIPPQLSPCSLTALQWGQGGGWPVVIGEGVVCGTQG